ncbi:hypothetical protein [Comamonas koreensis]|uniref:hypothetical protein n=1 Tax=Comamonas koreensis TaxID=160825 RepID=UPI0015FE0D95|nr:hypothetical protein [Comamonas koreensis]
MKINLSPQVRSDALEVLKDADKLTINGELLDFTQLPEGGVLPAAAVDCEFIIGDVRRQGGELQLTLLLPIAWDAPESCAFPLPILNPVDGRVPLPTDEVPNA